MRRFLSYQYKSLHHQKGAQDVLESLKYKTSDFWNRCLQISGKILVSHTSLDILSILWKMLLLETLRACLQLCLINYLINWTPSTKICVCLSGLFLRSKQAMCFRLRGKHDRKAIHYAPVQYWNYVAMFCSCSHLAVCTKTSNGSNHY